MRHYELMVILDPSLDERTVTPSLEQFLTVVKNDGGTVEKIEVWGKRRLAFEILKHAEGIYAVIEVACEPATISELDRQLGLNESVLRTKVLRREPKKARAQKAAAPSSPPASAPAGAPRTATSATSATAAVAAASAPAAAPAAG
jgi:small subunit ribosomal protein S6